MPNLHGAARQLSRLRHVWNINGRSRERERGKKRRLIEYGRFSLVDKADNQLVKMLMHSPVVMPASRPRVFTSFRSVPTGQKLSAGSNRLIYLFWMDVSFFIKKKKVRRVFEFQAVLWARAIQAGDWRLHGQRRRLAERSLVRLQLESLLHVQSVRKKKNNFLLAFFFFCLCASVVKRRREITAKCKSDSKGTTTDPASTAPPCSRAAGGGNRADEDSTASTWPTHKILQPDKVLYMPTKTEKTKKKKERKKDGDCSLTFRVSPRHRYRLVPLARMGLYSQTGHDDDPPATLRQRAVDAQSSRENFQIIMGKKVEKFYHNIKRKISANQIHNETIADSISVCPQFSIRSLQLQYYSHYPKTNRKNWI